MQNLGLKIMDNFGRILKMYPSYQKEINPN